MVLITEQDYQPICRPQRPGYGTIGHHCIVNSNHFGVNVGTLDYCDDNGRIPSGAIIYLDDISEGRSLYLPDHECRVIGNGVEYRKGFYGCFRPIQMDSLTETLYEPVLVSDFVFAYLGNRDISTPLPIIDLIKIKRTLKGVEIRNTVMENERNHVILDLSTLPLDQLTFLHTETGEMTTVVQFYREKYKINLKYPYLPALRVGNESNPLYFPMELSGIVAGQRYTKKLNEKQEDAFLKKSCDHPNSTKESIFKILKGYIAKVLGSQLNTTFTPIDARVLSPLTLKYLGAREIPKMGVWNMMDKKFVSGAKVERWACLSFSQVPQDILTRFCNDLVKMCRGRGMQVHGDGGWKFVELFIIILPEVHVGSYYARIKRFCDPKVISQCCERDLVQRYTNETLANMASKINIKAGGRNISIKYVMETSIPLVTSIPTIIFGGHVNHPDPRDHSSPSIAGVVASMDWPDVTIYRALISEHPCKDEIINDLYTSCCNPGKDLEGGMIRELLVAFYKTTSLKPSRIIFYRDAVSNGQITEVLQKEIMAIRKGTIKPAHYHVIQDENYFTPDELQSLTNILCYTYARGTRAVSIVAPVKHAQLATSRGRCYIGGESTEVEPPDCSDGGIDAVRERIERLHRLPELNDEMQSRMFYC